MENIWPRLTAFGFIDYEKAFDSVEHFAIFDALRQININEKYVNILENIYLNATAKVHIDNMERSETRGSNLSEIVHSSHRNGLNMDGETLTNLRFADDVALVTEDTKSME
ncbi:endonuclease-reverse transcriptase [Elysia marginata]|uniref:Endonuclease-reverse transcriptase n=1 Tax=Elysia marginata TaxID=1093978 RepID=A0AAV4F687_9GAST|nr:endonuclease-reverse transcriptase [Elysia marginata]